MDGELQTLFFELAEAVDDTDVVRGQVALPVSLGGCGVGTLEARHAAAFAGSWAQSMHGVLRRLPAADARTVVQELGGGSSGMRLSRDLRAADATLLHRGVQPSQLVVWSDVAAEPKLKAQRSLSRILARAARTKLLEGADDASQARIRSCGGRGAGAFLVVHPAASDRTGVSDGAWQFAVRGRLGLPTCVAGSRCKVWNKRRQRPCGEGLDAAGDHVVACRCGGHKTFRHSRLVCLLRSILRESGASVEPTEVPVRAWHDVDGADGRLDVAATIRGQRVFYDVTVCHTRAQHVVRRAAADDGAAAKVGEERKRSRYPAVPQAGLKEVTPFAVETFGRLGPAAVGVLHEARIRIAERDARCRGWASAALQARWFGQISCALATSLFEAAQCAWGEVGRGGACDEYGLPLPCVAADWA